MGGGCHSVVILSTAQDDNAVTPAPHHHIPGTLPRRILLRVQGARTLRQDWRKISVGRGSRWPLMPVVICSARIREATATIKTSTATIAATIRVHSTSSPKRV